jgi:hypothetical protein
MTSLIFDLLMLVFFYLKISQPIGIYMKFALFTALLISTFASFESNAENILTQCNTCSTSSSYEVVAEYVGDNNGSAVDFVYVANFKDQVVNKYKVVTIKSREPGVPDITQVHSQILTLAQQNSMQLLLDNVAALQGGPVVAPKDIADSAYELIGSTSTQNNLKKSYIDNQSLEQRIENVTAAIASTATNVINVNFVIEFSFSDGSKATFKITGIDGDGNVQLTLTEAIDADLNQIPITKDALLTNGSMNFSTQGKAGMTRYLDAAARFGIPISTGASTLSSGGTMTCVVTRSGGLSCTLKTK